MNIRAIRIIWVREILVQLRDRAGLISSVARSLVWLLMMGGGFGAARFAGLTVDYQAFILPGIVAMSLQFTSIRSGISVIWDREFGFMKEILVSPASRFSIMAGKVLGGVTVSLGESAIILALGPFLGVHLTVVSFAESIAIMALISATLVSMGLVVSAFLKTFEGFQTIMTFIIMPMFFLSGALFPLDGIPSWMVPFTVLNPLTYAVDALRIVLIGVGNGHLSLEGDLLVLLCALAVTMALGTGAFKKSE
ncbi:ABC-2 type transporter [uncultured archaeon]|nr:ABC-2 type transporter [uncultured archaeon]